MWVVKVIVPVSGGKDSQACLKFALMCYPPEEVVGLFCDTKFEHPITYDHIDRMAEMYGVVIHRVCGGSVIDKTLKYGRFPGGGARHCTDELKIRETRLFLKAWNAPVEVWYGMRSNESHERKVRYADKELGELYEPHEVMPRKYPRYLGKMGIRFRLPVLDWTTADVMQFLDGTHNPLYDAGFDRVGCFPCLAAGDATKKRAFQYDNFGREQHILVSEIGRQIGKSIWTSKGINCEVCSI